MTRKIHNPFLSIVIAIGIVIGLIGVAALAQAPLRSPDNKDYLSPTGNADRFGQADRHLQSPKPGNAKYTKGFSHPDTAHPQPETATLWQSGVTYGSGGYYATAPVVADVNGDGKPDIIVANCAPSGAVNCFQDHGVVAVLLANGDGTFQSPVTYDSGGYLATSLAVADLNGDGKPDLVVGHQDGTVAVLLGNGDGTFQPEIPSTAENYVQAVAIADVNGDGIPDIIAIDLTCSMYSCVGVLLGNGSGIFQLSHTYAAGGIWANWVSIADVNGDGNPDLLLAYGCVVVGGCSDNVNGGVGVLLGQGDGTFKDAVTYDSGGRWAYNLAVADVNGDGKLDLVVANSFSDNLGILLGNGDGTFQSVVTLPSGGTYPRSVTVADVNGDGKPDLVVPYYLGDRNGKYLGVLLGNGDGNFQAATSFDTGNYATSLASVVDVNGDGKPDLIVGGAGGNNNSALGSVSVLLNNSTGTVPTTTTLTSSLNPTVFGQTVTFTATVTAESGTPTGAAIFYDGSTQIGSGTLTNGSTAISVVSITTGTHSITAAYQGSGDFEPSTSAPVRQTVNPATTKTSLTSSSPRTRIKTTITYTATVTGQYGGTATGTVEFKDNGAVIANVALAGNQARYTLSYNRRGIHSIVATYSGDQNNLGSISPSLVELISHLRLEMRPHLTSSVSPSMVGQAVSFTLTVDSPWGLPPDGDWVYFFRNKSYLGAVQMVGGAAVFTTSDLSAGSHAMRGVFAGDSVFRNGDDWFRQFVNRYTTTSTLASTPNPSRVGDTVTFTFQVSSSGPMPTGTVKFFQGGTLFATTQLSDGIAVASTASLRAGTHQITARYVGDAYNGKSTSPTVYQVVQ